MPKEGLEPTLPYGKRILNPPRLPFRHFGFCQRCSLVAGRRRVQDPSSWGNPGANRRSATHVSVLPLASESVTNVPRRGRARLEAVAQRPARQRVSRMSGSVSLIGKPRASPAVNCAGRTFLRPTLAGRLPIAVACCVPAAAAYRSSLNSSKLSSKFRQSALIYRSGISSLSPLCAGIGNVLAPARLNFQWLPLLGFWTISPHLCAARMTSPNRAGIGQRLVGAPERRI